MRTEIGKGLLRSGAGLFLAFCLVAVARAEEEPSVVVEVIVTAEEGGAAISQASVYLKFKEERFLRRDKKTEWTMKTDPEGKAKFPALPEGQALVQVVAKGWKTYGRYHTLRGPHHTLEITLKRPPKWY
jgi:hypothetical protein